MLRELELSPSHVHTGEENEHEDGFEPHPPTEYPYGPVRGKLVIGKSAECEKEECE
jgi:hypothetical protein